MPDVFGITRYASSTLNFFYGDNKFRALQNLSTFYQWQMKSAPYVYYRHIDDSQMMTS